MEYPAAFTRGVHAGILLALRLEDSATRHSIHSQKQIFKKVDVDLLVDHRLSAKLEPALQDLRRAGLIVASYESYEGQATKKNQTWRLTSTGTDLAADLDKRLSSRSGLSCWIADFGGRELHTGLLIYPTVRYLARRGSMMDHWVIVYLWAESHSWVICFVREYHRSQFELMSMHRRVWQSASVSPFYLDRDAMPQD